MRGAVTRHYLVACDFDQTLSFNDSGAVLSEMIGASSFREKVAGLSRTHLVQQGAELAYLLRHDPEFRCVRREHLIEAGRRVRLKQDVRRFVEFLRQGVAGYRFSFRVISAAPKTIIESALDGIAPPEHIHGAELDFDPTTGEISAVRRVSAGYGKVAVLEELEEGLQIGPGQTVYVGDGSSDLHVMMNVNNRDGFTIAVSEAKCVARIAKRTVISENALSVAVPILEDVVGWDAGPIRDLFESYGLVLREWDKVRTDWVTLREDPSRGVEPLV